MSTWAGRSQKVGTFYMDIISVGPEQGLSCPPINLKAELKGIIAPKFYLPQFYYCLVFVRFAFHLDHVTDAPFYCDQ